MYGFWRHTGSNSGRDRNLLLVTTVPTFRRAVLHLSQIFRHDGYFAAAFTSKSPTTQAYVLGLHVSGERIMTSAANTLKARIICSVVFSVFSSATEKKQVARIVIKLVMIQMMHLFRSFQTTTNNLRHNMTVFINSLTSNVDRPIPIFRDVATFIIRTIFAKTRLSLNFRKLLSATHFRTILKRCLTIGNDIYFRAAFLTCQHLAGFNFSVGHSFNNTIKD